MTFTVRFVLSQFIFFFFPDGSLSYVFLFLVKLSAPYEFFFVLPTILAGFHQWPQRQGRPPRGPLCSRPWAGPSAPVLAGLLSAAGCLAPRAADLADVCCRVD